MRAPTFVSVFALLLIGCGDDASRTGKPGDSSASDVGSEAGNPIDAGAFDATAPRDATHADAPSSPSSNADASGIADATGNVDSRAVDAMSAADASAVNGPDGNGEDAGPCANGSWDGGFCCGAANTPTPEGPDDCGRCGHRCGGGACSSGVCQPFVVATLPDTFGPYDIAANDSLVFVSGMNSNEDASVIYSVPLDGGGAQVLTHASDPPVQLFADPSTLYWAGIQSISSDSIDGGGVTTIAARDTSSIAGFGADPSGAFLYWGEVSNTGDLTVWMDPVDASAPSVIWDGGNQQCAGVEFSATAHDVYWTYNSNNSGSIVPVLTAALGSTAVSSALSLQNVELLATQGGDLFALAFSSTDQFVESVSLFDGGAPRVYSDEAGATDFAVDPSWLYILDGENTLRAYPFDGGKSVVLDDNLQLADFRFVNAPGFIYWVSPGPPLVVMGVATP